MTRPLSRPPTLYVNYTRLMARACLARVCRTLSRVRCRNNSTRSCIHHLERETNAPRYSGIHASNSHVSHARTSRFDVFVVVVDCNGGTNASVRSLSPAHIVLRRENTLSVSRDWTADVEPRCCFAEHHHNHIVPFAIYETLISAVRYGRVCNNLRPVLYRS